MPYFTTFSTLSVQLTRIMLDLIVSHKDNRWFKIKEPLILSQEEKNSLFVNDMIQTSDYKILRHWFLSICLCVCFFHNSLHLVGIQGTISWMNKLYPHLLYTLFAWVPGHHLSLSWLFFYCTVCSMRCSFQVSALFSFIMIKCPSSVFGPLLFSCTLATYVI